MLYEQEMAGKTPDLHVRHSTGSVLVEVSTLFEPEPVRGGRATQTELSWRVADLRSELAIGLQRHNDPCKPVDVAQALQAIQHWLGEVAGGPEGRQELSLSEYGASATFWAEPADEHAPGFPDVRYDIKVGSGDPNVNRVASKLKKKARQEKTVAERLNLPLVIALADEMHMPVSEVAVDSALFGGRFATFHVSPNGQSTPPTEGRWTQGGQLTRVVTGKDLPIHSSVSAVMALKRRTTERGFAYSCSVTHNPFAVRPVSPDLFGELRQLRVVDRPSSSEARMEWDAGSGDLIAV